MLGLYSTTDNSASQVDNDNSASAQVKQGFSSLLGGITKVLTVPPDDDTEDDVLRVTSTGNLEVFDKAKVCQNYSHHLRLGLVSQSTY